MTHTWKKKEDTSAQITNKWFLALYRSSVLISALKYKSDKFEPQNYWTYTIKHPQIMNFTSNGTSPITKLQSKEWSRTKSVKANNQKQSLYCLTAIFCGSRIRITWNQSHEYINCTNSAVPFTLRSHLTNLWSIISSPYVISAPYWAASSLNGSVP